MSGDYSNGNRVIDWAGTMQTQGQDILFPGGSTSLISSPDNADWSFAGDFCIELFGVKFTNAAIRHGLISQYNASGSQRGWGFEYRGDLAPKRFTTNLSNDGTAITSIDWNFDVTAAVPYDICFERAGSTVRAYVGGVMIGTAGTFAGAFFNSNQPLDIGAAIAQTSDYLTGSIRAVRVTKLARYASNSGYAVPALPLPTS